MDSSDRETDWGEKTYKGKRPDGSIWEKLVSWFGYKMHLLVDTIYELPVGYKVTKASRPDIEEMLPMVKEAKDKHFQVVIETLAGDKAYADWGRKFQGFLHNKLHEELSATDVKAYLTYLAVKCKVSASTQNQAFNALLFLYCHILKKDFGDHKDIPRAKKGYLGVGGNPTAETVGY